jgi:hypothetical protein
MDSLEAMRGLYRPLFRDSPELSVEIPVAWTPGITWSMRKT